MTKTHVGLEQFVSSKFQSQWGPAAHGMEWLAPVLIEQTRTSVRLISCVLLTVVFWKMYIVGARLLLLGILRRHSTFATVTHIGMEKNALDFSPRVKRSAVVMVGLLRNQMTTMNVTFQPTVALASSVNQVSINIYHIIILILSYYDMMQYYKYDILSYDMKFCSYNLLRTFY